MEFSYSRNSCCISFDSYIKPQLNTDVSYSISVVYLLIPTSNHNFTHSLVVAPEVVYLLIPTSNHNSLLKIKFFILLYIFWFLHQTTTLLRSLRLVLPLYIFWFLHQTTTYCLNITDVDRCISFDSYIKPQLTPPNRVKAGVVYLLIPTSNHNSAWPVLISRMLYIFWFLHQTTTGGNLYRYC